MTRATGNETLGKPIVASVSVLVLGVVALLVILGGVSVVIFLARRQANDEPPASKPGDFVAPVSSGGYRFRQTDESQEQFQTRVAQENAKKP